MLVPQRYPINQAVKKSRFGDTLGQIGQELYIEVYTLERIIRAGVPNTHTRVARRSVGPPRTPRGKQNESKSGKRKLGEDGTSDADLLDVKFG